MATTNRSRAKNIQPQNQQRRTIAQDARVAFLNYPTFANGFRAWLTHLRADETFALGDYRSATTFIRILRAFKSKGPGDPDYPETTVMSAEPLVGWVDEVAWSLNAKHTLNDNAAQLRTPTSRIGRNFRSLILFLGRTGARVISQSDFTYLLDECRALEEDLARTARINRIMEEYVIYVQEAYFDAGRTVDETYYGEYEVERIHGRRLVRLRRYDPDGSCTLFIRSSRQGLKCIGNCNVQADGDASSHSGASPRSFATYFPTILAGNIRHGDTLTLQICHLEDAKVWVPFMYSGFTPSREDGGVITPTESPDTSGHSRVDGPEAVAALQNSLQQLEIRQTRRRSSSHREERRSLTPQRPRAYSQPQSHAETPTIDFDFDETKFTDAYFRAWEGDIDSDEDFSDLPHPP